MTTYAIGDIQGCYSQLRSLLDEIDFRDSDRVWFTGDLVNRGPESLETLRFVKSLEAQAVVVLGNHDLHLLAVAHGYAKLKTKDTLNDILLAPDRIELLDWLSHQPLIHHDPLLQYSMVHAGIPPIWDLQEALAHAAEVEEVLASDLAHKFFKHMYGNKPNLWKSDLKGWERLRLITNYLTRMRFCKANGKLELETKTAPEYAPEGYKPWYAFPKRKTAGERLVFGHWAAMMGRVRAWDLFPIDTGCVWGQSLTALRLEDGMRFSQPCTMSR